MNELHLSYLRDITNLGQPVGGRGVSLVSQGFANANGTPSIVALDPKGQSVENLNFNGYSIGAAANQLIQTNNTYQGSDTFSKVLGNHTMKMGGEFHADQVNAHPIAQFNGSFVFSGTETGVDFADFLIGVPSQYNQSQLNPFYARNRYVGLFAQDSWHARPSLTLNYGLRWDRIAPWTEKYNQISTFVAGAQSVVFPGAPAGILYPGDPGVPTHARAGRRPGFSPRVGVAWSPQAAPAACWERFWADPGTTSIRASFGNFYTAIDALSISVLAANAPYGTTYTSPAPPLFATPFVTAADGQNYGQPFPYTFAPLNSSRSHPDCEHRLEHLRADQRHSRIRHSQPRAVHRRVDAFDRAAGGAKHRAQRKLHRHGEPSAARADRAEPRQSRAVPEPEPAQRSAARHAHLRPRRRKYGLLPDWRRAGERNARAAGGELRQQCAAIDHRRCQLQRA